jgi:urate oxidase
MKLLRNSYGKARVRVLKVIRRGRRHSVKELEISVMLQGRFAASYAGGDNRLVVATDTMKNTVNLLARRCLGAETEAFGLALSGHFLETYRQVEQIAVRLSERCWERIAAGRRPHPHSFVEQGAVRPFAEVTATRKSTVVQSGIEDLLVLKTAGSGFEGFVKNPFTTLRDTGDRLLRTRVNARWTHATRPASYSRVNRRIVDSLLQAFASAHSPSVQSTLFHMGEAALKAAPGISKISLALPNQHCLLIDLSPFDVANRNELFVPTEEPHGQIEGTVAR